MSHAQGRNPPKAASRANRLGALGWADGLTLAAAPSFAAMAVFTGFWGGQAPGLLCSSAHAAAPLGMTTMYVLMSAFHAPPWLKLIAGRRRRRSPDGVSTPHATHPNQTGAPPWP